MNAPATKIIRIFHYPRYVSPWFLVVELVLYLGFLAGCYYIQKKSKENAA